MTDTTKPLFPRKGCIWVLPEYLMVADAFVRNDCQWMGRDHPVVVSLANYWGRTPGAIVTVIEHLCWALGDDEFLNRYGTTDGERMAMLYARAHYQSKPELLAGIRKGL